MKRVIVVLHYALFGNNFTRMEQSTVNLENL